MVLKFQEHVAKAMSFSTAIVPKEQSKVNRARTEMGLRTVSGRSRVAFGKFPSIHTHLYAGQC